ncbi:MAG: PDZ domain-containing protein, partial [Scytonema sp. PMC 1069.18]|nr:PDZ domain-containing protein [Scytonema sp. PMC 1069.18]
MNKNKILPSLELTPLNEPQIDILRGASFGAEGIWQIFQGGEWTFYTNGKFTFTSQFSQVDPPISGTYAKVGTNFEFQSEQAFDDNSTISIDGTICINEENLVLDAIYTNSNSPQQIARISQYLITGRAIQKPEPLSGLENSFETQRVEINDDDLMTQLEALGINDDLIEKEIEGIKIPNQFRISLEGKTDKGAFSSLPGTLLIINKTASEFQSQSHLSITLAVNPELFGTNGFIVINSEENSKEAPNTQINVSNNQVRLEFSSSDFMRSTTYTLGAYESSPDLYRQVLVENGILTFTVEENQISGEVKASGIIPPRDANKYFSNAERSTYEGKLTGEIPTSPPVEKLKAALSLSFNGQWDISNSHFGQIKLQQNGQQVSGTYTEGGGGTIEGIARGNRFDFTWQDRQQREKGRGFLRAVAGGGKLVGIWWREDMTSQETKSECLIASWQLPSFITTETFSPFDLQELRFLGHELILQGREEQAALLLNRVIISYLAQQQEETPAFEVANVEKEKELEKKLISAAFSLNFLINCHFQLGDYEQLLKSLDYGLKIQRLLGPEESANRLFRRLTADIANTLTSNAERFEVMEKVYRNWQQVVSGSRAVIGIYLEQDENKEVIVSGIEEKQPAYLAGIMPQDEILKIDGKIIQGLDKQQVLENLGGKPGTLVTITVRRSNQELEFQLTRGKIEINSAQRQAEIVKTLTFFADSLNRLRESSKNNLNKINTSAQRIAQGQEKPVSTLLSVTRY